jgi:hypothetical protein
MSRVQCYLCLSVFVLCTMLPVSLFLCLVPSVARVYHSVSCAQCYQCPMLPVSIFLCLVSYFTRVYLSVSSAKCYQCLSFCVLCPIFPVSLFLCFVSNAIRGYLCVSCVQCCPCLSFSILCPMLPVSIFLCLWTQNTQRYTQETLDTRHRKIDTSNIGHKTQKDRYGQHWAHDTER